MVESAVDIAFPDKSRKGKYLSYFISFDIVGLKVFMLVDRTIIHELTCKLAEGTVFKVLLKQSQILLRDWKFQELRNQS